VRRAQTSETPTLHRTGKTLTLCVPGDIDLLPSNEVIRTDRGADRDKPVFTFDAELSNALLQADFGLGKMLTLWLVDILLLGFARTELDSKIAIAVSGTVRNNLAVFQ
jgi:hypothetical protein